MMRRCKASRSKRQEKSGNRILPTLSMTAHQHCIRVVMSRLGWALPRTSLIQRLGKWIARVLHGRSRALHRPVFERSPPVALNAAAGIKCV